MSSFQVEATDGSGYAPNALRFATKEEAEAYARDLFLRWWGCQGTRVVESEDAVNYHWDAEAEKAVRD